MISQRTIPYRLVFMLALNHWVYTKCVSCHFTLSSSLTLKLPDIVYVRTQVALLQNLIAWGVFYSVVRQILFHQRKFIRQFTKFSYHQSFPPYGTFLPECWPLCNVYNISVPHSNFLYNDDLHNYYTVLYEYSFLWFSNFHGFHDSCYPQKY